MEKVKVRRMLFELMRKEKSKERVTRRESTGSDYSDDFKVY